MVQSLSFVGIEVVVKENSQMLSDDLLLSISLII
jgi:hypothetical protein